MRYCLLCSMSPWPICLFVCDDTYLCTQDERKLFICTVRCSVCSSVCLSACHTQPVEGTPGAVTLGVCFVDTCIGIFHVSSSVVRFVLCWDVGCIFCTTTYVVCMSQTSNRNAIGTGCATYRTDYAMLVKLTLML